MITKMIATFQDGHKVIRERPDWNLRYCNGLKHNCKRPHLIQFFGYNFTKTDIKEIYNDARSVLHPMHRKVTVNGEFLNTIALMQ